MREASGRSVVDQAVQSLGGNSLTEEYGIASMLTHVAAMAHRAGRPREDLRFLRPNVPQTAPLLLTQRRLTVACDGPEMEDNE
jgi:hypothetical protein